MPTDTETVLSYAGLVCSLVFVGRLLRISIGPNGAEVGPDSQVDKIAVGMLVVTEGVLLFASALYGTSKLRTLAALLTLYCGLMVCTGFLQERASARESSRPRAKRPPGNEAKESCLVIQISTNA